MSPLPAPANELAIWHDVECGAYRSDLVIWTELAAECGGPILELGAGTGRVALTLARAGHAVMAVDNAPALLAELRARAPADTVAVETIEADVRSLALDREFALVIAPMQLLQVLTDAADRHAALHAMHRHLRPGGVAAAAIVEVGADAAPSPTALAEPLPDVREVGGWVYSSLPVEVGANGTVIEARRLRQRVSPDGELSEQLHVDRLVSIDADELDREAAAIGLQPLRRLHIPSDDLFVGATVCAWSLAP
jgi:SAM-dependent methyltransferase